MISTYEYSAHPYSGTTKADEKELKEVGDDGVGGFKACLTAGILAYPMVIKESA